MSWRGVSCAVLSQKLVVSCRGLSGRSRAGLGQASVASCQSTSGLCDGVPSNQVDVACSVRAAP
eukprot:436753-Rhodomonas_salina.1